MHFVTAFFIPKLKMKVLFLNTPLKFSVIPRVYPLSNDSLSLTLRKEINNIILTPEFTFSVGQKLEITLTEQPIEFAILDKYEIEIKNDNEVIYLGKLQILKEGTNTQDFEYGNNNGRYSY